jgi:flagellar biosynthesis/type III secretory pathway M-ring protein FliF/YscJ
MMKLKNKKLLISLLITVVLITVFTILWKTGTDEVYFLCGNFSAGETKSNVIRQLETANLSSYTHEIDVDGSIIVFSSRLFFVTNQCIIKLDKSEKVVIASYK